MKKNKKLYLFGAGRYGKKFVASESFYAIKEQYDAIAFFDNNEELVGKLNGVPIEHDMWNDEGDKDIIITSGYWNSIYAECILNDCVPKGIYSMEKNAIYTFEEMCMMHHRLYRNTKRIKYEASLEREIDEAADYFYKTGELFNNIKGVAIMLSNLCNYAGIHPKCPASCVKEKEILSGRTVVRILDELAERNFDGIIYFHVYNEPMIDPRLFYFIDYAKKKMSNVTVMVYSNGYYLNQTMVEDLKDIGTDILTVTGYGEKEYRRLLNLEVDLPYRIEWGNLDDRLDLYKHPIKGFIEGCPPCRSFIRQVCIYSNGDVGVCCLDHEHPYGLGNIHEHSLREILNSEKVVTLQKKLLKGDRSEYPICLNCNWKR